MNVKFVVHSQCMENYGTHAENGKHEDGNAYWKFKGGDTYIIHGTERVQDAVAAVMAYTQGSNTIAFKEFPVKWEEYTSWWDELTKRNDATLVERELENAIKLDVTCDKYAFDGELVEF
tara:strand:+ start:27 stop:383 length:357 start_codon:yes stop_codon:yes gene_type:complete